MNPIITVTDEALPINQEPSPIPRQYLDHQSRSHFGVSEEILPGADTSSFQSYLSSPWAQPNALEKLLAWHSVITGDDLDSAGGNSARSEISASHCFSNIKDENELSRSELISAIMVRDQH